MNFRKDFFVSLILLNLSVSLGASCDKTPLIGNQETPRSTPTTTPTGPRTVSTGDQTVNGKTINSTMNDADILKAFNIDIAKATARRSHGPDGFSMTYVLGEQNVSITRSIVSGINVIAWGPIKVDVRLSRSDS